MIEKIICEDDSESNYKKLPEERKEIYRKYYKKITCCPEQYVISVDVASENCKDQSCVTKYNYEEYLKGNLVTEEIKYF